jgi:hypothetical protein
MRLLIALCLFFASLAAAAMTPEQLLEVYRAAAATASHFKGFSAERGRTFYEAKITGPNGEHSCAGCHGPDPRSTIDGHGGAIRAECRACHLTDAPGPGERSKMRRHIRPLAPSANPDRFTDADKVELWFDVNCFFVLGRPCTAQEKGDLLTYLLSVK